MAVTTAGQIVHMTANADELADAVGMRQIKIQGVLLQFNGANNISFNVNGKDVFSHTAAGVESIYIPFGGVIVESLALTTLTAGDFVTVFLSPN